MGQKRKAEDVPGNSKVQALDSAPEVPGTDAQAADSGAVKAGAAEAQAAFETDGGEALRSDERKSRWNARCACPETFDWAAVLHPADPSMSKSVWLLALCSHVGVLK